MKTNETLAALLLFASACGGGSAGTEPDDMSAQEHRQAAAAEEAEASGHGVEQQSSSSTLGQNVTFDLDQYDPRAVHEEMAREHRELAEQHRRAAEALEAFEDAQCGSFPEETRALCPLLGQVAAAEDVPGGVRLAFVEGANVNAIKAHIRCHDAFARTHGREGMEHCPMYVEGLVIADESDAVLMTTDAEGAVEELRRRANAHVVDAR